MSCRRPLRRLTRAGLVFVPCGRCSKCLRERVSQWTTRQQLEAAAHGWRCAFLTLTYAEAFRPGDRAELKAHLRNFLKRLRRLIDYNLAAEDVEAAVVTPAMQAGFAFGRFRFFACFEYGEVSGREHFHLNLFGLSAETVIGGRTLSELVEAAWSFGRSKVKPMLRGAARYVAKYLLKGVGHGDVEARLGPEFRTISNGGGRSGFGGIGAPAVPALAADHVPTELVTEAFAVSGDVERKVALGNAFGFLDRYLSDRLRQAVGFSVAQIAALRLARLRELVARSRDERWRELTAELRLDGASMEARYAKFRRYWSLHREVMSAA